MFKYGIRTFYLFIFKYPKYDIICLTRERIHRPWSPFSIVLFSTVQKLPAGGTLLYVKVVFFATPLGLGLLLLGLLLLGLLLLGLLLLGFGFLRENFQSEIHIINRS